MHEMKAATELRALVDAFAARHAAARVAAGASKRPLLAAFKRLQEATRIGDLCLMGEADRALHRTIVSLAEVAGLEKTWLAAADATEHFRTTTLATCWPDLNVLFEAHRPIVDAICAGDVVAAEDAAKSHLDAVWYRLADVDGEPSGRDAPVARCCSYLDFHLHHPVSLRFLAEHVAGTSPGHLARLFRELRGTSVTGYVRGLRMRKAVSLLTTTAEPVGRIASLVGYADASRFAEHFRRHYGRSPLAHRRRFSRGRQRPG
jgi:AraC-like DNA-binding protein